MGERSVARPSVPGAEFGRVFRFCLTGLINTAVGGGIIFMLQWGFHIDPFIANAGGFIVGLGSGFILNSKFVFRNRPERGGTFGRYITAIALAFSFNQMVLRLLIREQFEPLGLLLAQGAALASYSAICFILCRFWVFRRCRE
jgi:putative flippase GtrA